MLPLALAQVLAVVAILRGVMGPSGITNHRRWLGVLWIGTFLALAMQLYWVPRMMPTIVLRAGIIAPKPDDVAPEPPENLN